MSRLALTPTNVPASASDISTPTLRTGDMYYNTSTGLNIYNGSAWTIGPSLIVPVSVSSIGLIIKGLASQTANLQEWQNSAGTVLTSISSTGKITSAVDASINGYTLGRGSGSIYTNVVFGYNAFASNTTGNQNVALGWGALTSNTTGSNNFALGNSSLGSVISGSGNVGIGSYALPVSTASNNIAIGIIAMYANTTGYGNVAIGAQALQANTTGIANTIIGQNALYSNLTGYFNTAIGNAAGFSNTGVANVFIGYNAGYNETGSNKLYIANTNTATPLIGGDFNSKTLTFAGNATVTSQATGTVGLIVKGAASQTANLQEWQTSDGSVNAQVTSGGILRSVYNYFNYIQNTSGSSNAYIDLSSGNTIKIVGGASYTLLTVKGAASQTANLQEWQDSSSSVITKINYNGGIDSTVQITGRSAVTAGTGNYLSASLNVIPLNASIVGAVIKSYASQTADLQQWQNSAGTVLSRVASNGVIKANVGLVAENNTSGNYTALQVNSYVPSGVGIIVKGAASQTANLQEWQNSAGTVLASIDYRGYFSIPNGVIQSYYFAPVGSGISILTLGGNQQIFLGSGPISANGSTSAYTVYIANSTAPTSNPIGGGAFYVESGALKYRGTSNAAQQIIGADGSVSFVSPTAATIGEIIKGAASQTANLQEWQNSAGTVLASINASGNATFNTLTVNTNNTVYFGTSSGIYGTTVAIKTYTDSNVGLVVQATGSGQTGNLQNWNNSVGIVLAKISASGNIVAGDMAIATSSVSTIHISNGTIPSANPTGGGVLYVEAGALKFRGSSGTITTIAVA